MSTTRTVNPEMLRLGLLQMIIEGMDQVPATWQQLVGQRISTRQQYEQTAHMSGIGLLRQITETEMTPLLVDQARGTKTYTPVEWGGRVIWNKRTKNKDIYNYTAQMGRQLGLSAVETQNLVAARTLANGASLGSNPTTSWDGQPVFGSHTTSRGSVWNNRLTLAASASSLQTMLTTLSTSFTDTDTPRRMQGGYKLVCGPGKVAVWTNVLYAEGGMAGTTDHSTNKYISQRVTGIVEEAWFTSGLLGYENSTFLLPNDNSQNPFFKLTVEDFQTETAWEGLYRRWQLMTYGEWLFDAKGHQGVLASIV